MKLDQIFSEKDAEQLSAKVLEKVTSIIKEETMDSLYTELEGFLYEHYQNAKEKIEGDLIDTLVESFIKEPERYKYTKIRSLLWKEHKEEIMPLLTEEAIKTSIENIILDRTSDKFHFNWQWKDGVADFILKNWDIFKEDERVTSRLLRVIQNKLDYIERLESEIRELKEQS